MLTADWRGNVHYFVNIQRGDRDWRETERTGVSGKCRVHSKAAELNTCTHTSLQTPQVPDVVCSHAANFQVLCVLCNYNICQVNQIRARQRAQYRQKDRENIKLLGDWP